ncbi:MAG TPA: heme-binding protein [Burkholderiales bacterium]
MQRIKLAILSAMLFPAMAMAQALVTERTLSVDAAREAATAALERCRKDGYNVTVTVLNKSGRLKAQLHDDNAGPHTIENSFRKAYTSITFKANSGEFGARIGKNPPPHPALVLANVTTAEGALLIRAGNEIVGAIGVSGAPGGDKDAVCAQAGIDRIARGLGG